MVETLSADHIAAQGGAFEPQRKNNFTLRLSVGGRIIQQSLQSFPLPKEANEVLEISYGNEQRKVAGRATFDNLELVLKDYADQPTMAVLVAWRRRVYQPTTGAIGLASAYKEQGEVVMFAPNGTLQRRWKLIGVWPSRNDPGGGDMNANEQNVITLTLVIDKAIELVLSA